MFVDKGAERQSVPERRSHVGDGNILVPLALDLTPLVESFDGRHPEPNSPNN